MKTTGANGEIEAAFYGQLGRLLKLKRRERGWSQQALAVEIGVHRNTVQRWESGQETVTVWMLLRAADVLCCPHLLLLPARGFVWGEELRHFRRERDPLVPGSRPVQEERDGRRQAAVA